MVYHIVHLCNLNDTRKFPLDIVHNHSRHYRMDWVGELNDIIMNFVHFPSISSYPLDNHRHDRAGYKYNGDYFLLGHIDHY